MLMYAWQNCIFHLLNGIVRDSINNIIHKNDTLIPIYMDFLTENFKWAREISYTDNHTKGWWSMDNGIER